MRLSVRLSVCLTTDGLSVFLVIHAQKIVERINLNEE